MEPSCRPPCGQTDLTVEVTPTCPSDCLPDPEVGAFPQRPSPTADAASEAPSIYSFSILFPFQRLTWPVAAMLPEDQSLHSAHEETARGHTGAERWAGFEALNWFSGSFLWAPRPGH